MNSTNNKNRLQSVNGFRFLALCNIKKNCRKHGNLAQFKEIRQKLIEKEKQASFNRSIEFYKSFYNLSKNNF
jgi:hypothetical protein